jgi:hypothetical protein
MYSANCTVMATVSILAVDGIVGALRDYQPVSPGSPEKAINVWSFNALVLSSVALRMVGPRIAALDAAIKVKSLPVMPSRTSLWTESVGNRKAGILETHTFWPIGISGGVWGCSVGD